MPLIQVRFISLPDVLSVDITMQDVIGLCTSSLRQHGSKNVENPPKKGIHTLGDSFIHSMPAWLKGTNECGLKLVAGYPSNVPKGLPTITGVLVLNDPSTGFPLAYMDATWITGMRTVAVSAVTAKELAPPSPKVLGICGAGVQGRIHAATFADIFDSLEKIKVYEVYEPNLEKFCKELKETFPRLDIEVVSSAKDAITGADIVLTCTGKLLKPMFHTDWVKEGALVLPIHTNGWNRDAPLKMDKLVTDDWEQYKEFATAYDVPDRPHAETGEIVAGRKKGRESPSERIICFNVGLAVHDIIVGAEVLRRAENAGIGTMFTLADTADPVPTPKFA